MAKKFLVTGARAPVALELARQLNGEGHKVYLADSFKHTLAGFSSSIEKNFCVTPPVNNPAQYIKDIKNICLQCNIDMVIPTCEEVYYLSWGKAQIEAVCPLFTDDINTLKEIHSKYTFSKMVEDFDVRCPKTTIITKKDELKSYNSISRDFVFKPEFSRFATETRIRPEFKELQNLSVEQKNRWVAQKYIPGQEYCTYSLSYHGQVRSHVCYKPKYRVGKGSGTYFFPEDIEAIRKFVEQFCGNFKFHGQIGFDFIRSQSGQIFVLEANPRATSGLHLIGEGFGASQFAPEGPSQMVCQTTKPMMVAQGVLIFHSLKKVFSSDIFRFLKDYWKARDVIVKGLDWGPLFGQFFCFAEIVKKSYQLGFGLQKAATQDIEWNGGPIG